MKTEMGANLERRLSERVEWECRQLFGLFAGVRHPLEIWSYWKRLHRENGHSGYAKLASRYTEQ